MSTTLKTLDFILGWQWRLLNRRVTGSEVCFGKITVATGRRELWERLLRRRGKSGVLHSLPPAGGAPQNPTPSLLCLPAAGIPLRCARSSASSPERVSFGPLLVRPDAPPSVTSALAQGSSELRRGQEQEPLRMRPWLTVG